VNGKSRILQLLALTSILGMSALGLVAAPAGAATAQHASTPVFRQTGHVSHLDGTHLQNFHSLLCLGIKGGGDNAPAIQWNCVTHRDQLWRTGGKTGGSYFQIINEDNECLGILGGSTREGARVYGWKCLGTSHRDQYWQIESGTCGGVKGFLMFRNYKSGYVMGVLGNSRAAGAAVVQWADQGICNNQVWFTG
jgi:hypothetical protein